MTRPPPDIPGHQFISHLGEGGYSDVYLYERRSPRMRVAVKVLKEGRLSPAELAQFAAEAETMAELADHPYIVQVFSSETTADDRPYLIMKFYPQPNLGNRAAVERFSVAETLQTGVKLASAVETAHRAGILHRDIKPANVLVSQYGEPGLTDFGIAGRAAESDEADEVGVSIPWSSPEVLTGNSNGTVQSDVYSLAATLWHLLVGRSPFEIGGGDNSAHALVQRIVRTPPRGTGRADVPAALERLIAQAMAKNPAVRPRSALEFAQALQGIEQYLRLERTRIVVEGVGGARSSAPTATPATGVDRTKMRAPTSVDPAAPATPTRTSSRAVPQWSAAPSHPDAAAEPGTRARPAVPRAPRTRAATPATGAAETTRRPTAVSDESVAPEAPSRRGVRRSYVAVAAAVAVAVAVAVGLVLTGTGSGGPRTEPTASVAGDPGLAQPPGQPIVTAVYDRAAHEVTFSWTYTGAKRGDYFEVGTSVDAPKHRVATARLTVKSTDPAKTCLVVAAFHDGSVAGSTISDRICGA